MPIPKNTLVLVVDGRKMLFLRNDGDAGRIDLHTESHDARQDAKDSDMKTDGAGTQGQSHGYGRPTYQETDYHQLAEDRWAADAAERVNKRALANDFDALAVIASPKTLGELRKHWNKDVQRRIIVELPKEMTDRPIRDIEQMLIGQGAPPQ